MFKSFPPPDLPNDVLSFKGEKFFELIQQKCGQVFKELMEILSINTVYKLLLVEDDILPVFQKKYRELEKVTQRACLHLDDGTIMLKPGLRMDFDRFIRSLHDINDKQKQQKEIVKQTEDIIYLFKNLVKSYQFNESDDAQDNYSFLFAFMENICNNISKNKNNYRYSDIVQQFAQSLYISGGRNSYEFVPLNLPGALLSLSTLNLSLEKADACIGEAEFRYDALNHHHNSLNYQITVSSEDSTAVVKKVSYNAATNTFGGFATPLENGIIKSGYVKTRYFDVLKEWFENKDKSNYLNVHMMQPLIESKPYTSSFLLGAYGISNTFKAIDILNRWIWIFEKSQESNVRIVAFSTDCDPRYLLAMRLTTDSIHLCATLRNRMLEGIASLLIENGEVSTQVVNELIETKSKFVHGLVKTDIKPSDRQNYKSCHKILHEEIINALEDIDGSLATRIYLRLLCSVALAYIDHNTSIIDRIYHSWLAVFICYIWQTWLHLVHKEDISESHSQMSKENLFITVPAHFCIEMNAHSLVAICLLVHQQDLPISALRFPNYRSQSLEATFRNSRSMSGVFSTVVNFTTEQFLKRADKLSVLADIQNQSESGQKQNKTEMLQVNSFVRAQFDRQFKKVSYDDDESYLSDNDESSYKFRSDINTAADLDDDSSCDDETENVSSISASGKSHFHGMRLCDTILSSLAKSYFRVELDGKKIYSQTDRQLAFNRYQKSFVS
ncbi:unnamed protein product [Rotaria magnacalcarata]|uniref:Uncharacterized protein n=1 Tax=Rotaria magnacalcarata TaxID=392030 RepID=A0A816H2P0_9BILA|nr:unnamed protein product [Rotaria magnacalcarata]